MKSITNNPKDPRDAQSTPSQIEEGAVDNPARTIVDTQSN